MKHALEISVIVCAHNPKPHYLARVLDALKSQALAREEWELLLVDNASAEPLAGRFDLSWHPNARHIREEELGLTPARLRGIAESKGDLLVFVDDDNLLSPDYLTESLAISQSHLWVGAWGGTISGEFEAPPAEWVKPLLSLLAIRHFDHEIWSNDASNEHAHPYGAGLCVRTAVARRYRDGVLRDPARRQLGRRGSSVLSGEDIDMVLTCHKLGLGWGNFPQLRLTHLIPASRLSERYLLRLREGNATSHAILSETQGFSAARPDNPWKMFLSFAYNFVRNGRRAAQFYLAAQRGLRAAHRKAESNPEEARGHLLQRH